MTLDIGLLLRHYKRKDIQDAMVAHFPDREVAVRYDEQFGKRPDVIRYPKDIIDFAQQGVTSFHCSEERWDNPLRLENISGKQLDDLRLGWDLVLDIDCALFEYSKICAELVIQFLRSRGVKDLSGKFSGNKGFHLGIPFEAFPSAVGGKDIRTLFPEAPRRIAHYVKENIKVELGKRILEFEKNDFGTVKDKTGKEEIVSYQRNEFGDKIAYLNVEPFLVIDTILLATRHLYRAPYSLHEKSGLVSVPIDPDTISTFRKEDARPGCPLSHHIFLDRNVSGPSATQLLVQAFDFKIPVIRDEEKKVFTGEEWTAEEAIPEELFPPCIKKLSEGLEDGRKRAVFCLMNFLGKMGWEKKQIETYLLEWNKRNKEPLRENYILSQLKYFKSDKLPPNCDNEAYYKDLGVYQVCEQTVDHSRIKNPVNYVSRRLRMSEQPREKKKKKTEQAD